MAANVKFKIGKEMYTLVSEGRGESPQLIAADGTVKATVVNDEGFDEYWQMYIPRVKVLCYKSSSKYLLGKAYAYCFDNQPEYEDYFSEESKKKIYGNRDLIYEKEIYLPYAIVVCGWHSYDITHLRLLNLKNAHRGRMTLDTHNFFKEGCITRMMYDIPVEKLVEFKIPDFWETGMVNNIQINYMRGIDTYSPYMFKSKKKQDDYRATKLLNPNIKAEKKAQLIHKMQHEIHDHMQQEGNERINIIGLED